MNSVNEITLLRWNSILCRIIIRVIDDLLLLLLLSRDPSETFFVEFNHHLWTFYITDPCRDKISFARSFPLN